MKRVLMILAFGLMFVSCNDDDSINYEDYMKKYKKSDVKKKVEKDTKTAIEGTKIK